ncbi:hypothetical protein ACNQ1O_01210 [Mycoplasma sp. B6188]|uniref:hypothetical protein n=1 Tax=Mycoplasma sp. B6188 TaxID=3401673 RepID=UPI003AB0D4CF
MKYKTLILSFMPLAASVSLPLAVVSCSEKNPRKIAEKYVDKWYEIWNTRADDPKRKPLEDEFNTWWNNIVNNSSESELAEINAQIKKVFIERKLASSEDDLI